MNAKKLVLALLCLGCGTFAMAAPIAYIPLGSANQVIAVDAANDKIIRSYSGVENPHGLVATPDGDYLVAGSLKETPVPAGAPSDTPNSKLYVIHPEHGHVMAEIPVSGWTHHEAVTPDGKYVISTHPTRGGVSVVDVINNKVYKTIKTGPSPNYTLVTKDGKRAYVSNSGNGTLSEIDLSKWEVTRSLEAGPTPEHLVFSPDEKTIYVSNDRAGTVSVVSVEQGKVEKTYKIGKRVHGLDLGDDGKTLFISSRSDDKLVALDTQTGEQRVLTLSPEPYHLDKIPGTGKVYVSSSKAPKIWVVDQKTFTVTDTIQLPAGEGHQIAVIR
ncbi:beta-propeller fold lactonase family protein [Thiobacillus sp.]|uniref:beta-propeller fold lactonase family protein n=1 Tax=Thiobacillus sp. TaxID=924 RepID=UPI00179ACD43|nr:beta-propeller fold lactonase family protein [Thiobacillus sp.]MBC2729319.1 beta-propeller fold lactonase family protein [Thiobacillus sp.]MBC2738054.1 beta-propeller fold lactonase family protein [Thiobacillus sp.]MBC2759645.1 beta-propeller fold lactonase family protein [Thiobacillus sp.]